MNTYGVDNVFKSDEFKSNLKLWRINNGYNVCDSDDKWKIYKQRCITQSTKVYKYIKDNWDGYDYYDGEYIKDNYNLNAMHSNYPTIDHKISIFNGYKNNIPIHIISCLDNLCITKRYINSSKHTLNEDEFILNKKGG